MACEQPNFFQTISNFGFHHNWYRLSIGEQKLKSLHQSIVHNKCFCGTSIILKFSLKKGCVAKRNKSYKYVRSVALLSSGFPKDSVKNTEGFPKDTERFPGKFRKNPETIAVGFLKNFSKDPRWISEQLIHEQRNSRRIFEEFSKNSLIRVLKGFLEGFVTIPERFRIFFFLKNSERTQKNFRKIPWGFPKGFGKISKGFQKYLWRISENFWKNCRRITEVFPKDSRGILE